MAAPTPPVLDEPQASSEAAIGASAMRKATLHLIPLIALGYGAAYMDRVNISFAALQMNRDLHFSATVYGFGAGLFFLSYAACEIPSNLLLYRFGARRWLARIMVTWGILAMGMLFVRTPWQFYTVRFLLGMSEAGFFPGVIFYLMQWFPPELRARTISRFYISLPLSSVFMGLIAGAAHEPRWTPRPSRLAVALPRRRPARRSPRHRLLPLSSRQSRSSQLAHRRRTPMDHPPRPQSPFRSSPPRRLRQPRPPRSPRLAARHLHAPHACQHLRLHLHRPGHRPALHPSQHHHASVSSSPASVSSVRSACCQRHALRPHARKVLAHHPLVPAPSHSASSLCGLSTRPLIVVPALGLLILAYNSLQGPLWSLPANFLKGRSAAAGIAAINMIGIIGGFLGPYFIGFAKDLTGDYQRGLRLMSLPMLFGAGIMFYLHRARAPPSTPMSRSPCVPSSYHVASPHEPNGHARTRHAAP